MDVFEAISARRSVREYADRPVDLDILSEILEAGKWAPTAGNLETRSIIIVKDLATRKQLAKAASQAFVAEAPVVMVVCADQKKAAKRYGKRGAYLYSIQDTAAAIQNMLLAIHCMGLGSCWVGAFKEAYVKRLLEIPKGVRPIALLPVGYRRGQPKAPQRDIDVHLDRW